MTIVASELVRGNCVLAHDKKSAERADGIGIGVVWGRSNERVDTYIASCSEKPIRGISPRHSVRPIPKHGGTFPAEIETSASGTKQPKRCFGRPEAKV